MSFYDEYQECIGTPNLDPDYDPVANGDILPELVDWAEYGFSEGDDSFYEDTTHPGQAAKTPN